MVVCAVPFVHNTPDATSKHAPTVVVVHCGVWNAKAIRGYGVGRASQLVRDDWMYGALRGDAAV